MELLDAMQVAEGKRKALPFLGTDELIDVHGMNGLIALVMATTVAKWLPASGETREEYTSHAFRLLRCSPVERWQPPPGNRGSSVLAQGIRYRQMSPAASSPQVWAWS